MLFDILLQVAIFLVLLFMFLFVHEVPQKLISKLRLLTRRSNLQARRHFVIGAQLLSQARSSSTSSSDVRSLAERAAAAEADKAIALDPKEAASHILKALALELLGFKTSALDSLDAALSPLAAKSLSDEERGDALFKRAELRAAVDGGGGGGAAVEDLVESVRLKGDNAKAYGLLGECYEKKGLIDEAQKAYENALRVQPGYVLARDRLTRLGL